MRAQTLRRLGTTTSRRPPPARTRQTSRNSPTGSDDISSACTSSTRSTAESVSGSSSSSTKAASAGLLAEQAQIGRRIADAQDSERVGVLPARTNAAADKAPGHDAEVLGVEIAQVDHIHEDKIARIGLRFRSQCGLGCP